MKTITFDRLMSLTLAACLASSPAFAELGGGAPPPTDPAAEAKLGFIDRTKAAYAAAAKAKADLAASYGDPAKPEFGKLVKGAKVPEGSPNVIFTGDRVKGSKLPEVMAISGPKGEFSHFGALNPNGTITWDQPAVDPGPTKLLTASPREAAPAPGPNQTGSGDSQKSSTYKETVQSNPAADTTGKSTESAKPLPVKLSRAERQAARAAAEVARKAQVDWNTHLKNIDQGKSTMAPPTIGETEAANAKPSQWRKILGLSAKNAQALGEGAAGQIKGFRSGLYKAAFPDIQSGNGLADAAANMNSLPAASISFAIALMGAAAINSALNPGTNPLALDNAHDVLHDEVTWIGMSGYILTSNFLMNQTRVAGIMQGDASLWVKAPTFGGVLAITSLFPTGINEFANDPDVKACIGWTNYHKTGNPIRDWAACDRAFSVPHLRDIATRLFVDKFIPSAAIMFASGTMIYAAMNGLGRLATIQNLFGGVAGLAGRTPMAALAIRLGASVGINLMLQSLIDQKSGDLFRYYGKFRQAEFTKQTGTYAATAENAERDLFASWAQIKKNKWADPSDTSKIDQKNICYDATRLGSKYYPCGSTGVDFEGALAIYDAQQAQWREQSLGATRALYEQWKLKVSSYHELFDYTKSFYKEAVAKIIYTLKNPQAPASDPMVFNLANMNVSIHTNWIPNGLRSLFFGLTRIDNEDKYRFVATPSLNEKLIADMACGPEVEGETLPTLITRGTNLFREHVARNLPAQEMLTNAAGRKVVFAPPRIVTSEDGINVCDQPHDHIAKDILRVASPWLNYMKDDVANFEVRTKEKVYHGLPDYILDHVRETVVASNLAGDPNRLPSWWNDFVVKRDTEVNDELAAEYQQVVDKFFTPALMTQDYWFCEPNASTKGSRLGDYLYRLAGKHDTCGATRSHRLANGVINNLRDQSRLYVAMMMDLYISNPTVVGQAVNQRPTPSYPALLNSVLVPAHALLDAYEQFAVDFAAHSDPAAMQESLGKLSQAFNAFKAVVNPSVQAQAASTLSPAFQREWMASLESKLNTSLATLITYVQLASLPRVGGTQ